MKRLTLFSQIAFSKTLLGAAFILFLACSPKAAQKTAETPVPPAEPTHLDDLGKPSPDDLGLETLPGDSVPEFELGDVVVTPPTLSNPDSLRPYHASHTFEHDLIHTKIEIGFDWAKKHAIGKATLTLRPWFYATDKVTLDAKNFDIQSVAFENQPSAQLKYDYDNLKLTIHLGKTFTRKEEFKLVVSYVAKPDERENLGGSAAITSDKGLYFINADGSDPDKPRQIWTQGETESNSCWFPTIDKPNERCTQEIFITVEDKFKTLSNGTLVSSKKNADGTRTDYYKMEKPHAPYLFMMAIGEFAVVKDTWNGLPLEYYVEPKYEPDAKAIFNHTPEMLSFFSKTLDFPFPWPKYSQVVVRDFVSGAMENTTGVIFGDFVQQTRRELLESHRENEKVVAHEMFHHWFGDLVTTESWANLTLNEGFANYSEYLWLEHKYGRDEADFHELQEQYGYIFSAPDGGHPLIHYGYGAREDMFDAHSYNKGGAALHMLRGYLGDEAFFASLNHYLKKHQFSDVEVAELRMAFEEVSGQDLHWFFNQWFLGAGHPTLDISYNWDEAAREMTVQIKQTQDATPEVARVFDIPMAVDIYEAPGKVRRENIRLTKRDNAFVFKCLAKPALVNVDADKRLLCLKEDKHSPEEWAFMFRNAPLFRDRWDALEFFKSEETPLAQQVFSEALNDKFWAIRQQGIEKVDLKNPASLAAIEKIAEKENEPYVKAAAIGLLGETGDKKYIPILEKALSPEEAYSVVGSALNALKNLDAAAAIKSAKSLENDDSEMIVVTLAELFSTSPDPSKLDWFKKHSAKVDNMAAFGFFEFYQKYLVGLNNPSLLDEAVTDWKSIASNASESLWRRFSATKSVADLRNHYRESGEVGKAEELHKIIGEIKEKESDPTLKLYYDMF